MTCVFYKKHMSTISFSLPTTDSQPRMSDNGNTVSETTQPSAKQTKSGKTPSGSPALKPRRKSSSAAAAAEPPPMTLTETAVEADATAAATPALLPEPMLQENKDRFVLFPLQHPDLWKVYKNHCAVIWFAEEVDLSKDMAHWEKLSDGERHFIKHILCCLLIRRSIRTNVTTKNLV